MMWVRRAPSATPFAHPVKSPSATESGLLYPTDLLGGRNAYQLP
jgi:hypothetical protein